MSADQQSSAPTISFRMSPSLAAYHQAEVEALLAEARASGAESAARAALGGRVPADLPEADPLRQAWAAASAELDRLDAYHRQRRQDLAKEIDPEELHRYRAAWQAHYARDANARDPKEHLSPSGRYRLLVTRHPTRPRGWDYSRGRVASTADDAVIAEIQRNYSAFPFSWVEAHPSGHDYLVAGEDYQGQTVVELDTGRRVDHLPQEAAQGIAFCWAAHEPSPDGLLLAVEGCFWACPYELLIVDFSRPMRPPWPVLYRCDSGDPTFLRWTSPVSCELRVERVLRRSDGKAEEELTPAELEELERLERQGRAWDELWDTRHETARWSRETGAGPVASSPPPE